MRRKPFERPPCPPLPYRGDDRVVTRDSTRDARQRRFVDPSRDKVRGARWSPDDSNRLDELDRKDQFPDQPGRAAIDADRPHQAKLLYVPRDRRLGGAQAATGERLG